MKRKKRIQSITDYIKSKTQNKELHNYTRNYITTTKDPLHKGLLP